METLETALDAYTMPLQRLQRTARLAPLHRTMVERTDDRSDVSASETSTERFVGLVLGKRPLEEGPRVGGGSYVEKPGGVSQTSRSLMQERRQRQSFRRKQQQLEEVLFAINAQSIEHEARAKSKPLHATSVPHGKLASNEAQKWLAVRCEQTDRLLLNAKRLVQESRDARKTQLPASLPATSVQFPSRGELSSGGSFVQHGGHGDDGILSSADSLDFRPPPHRAIPVTEWFSSNVSPGRRALLEAVDDEALPSRGNTAPQWNASTVVTATDAVRKVPLLVPGEIQDAPATDVEEVLRTIRSVGVAAAKPRTFVSQVVCALHTYGTHLDRSQRLQSVAPLLGQVKIPLPRKSFRDILRDKRNSEVESTSLAPLCNKKRCGPIHHEGAMVSELPPRATAASADSAKVQAASQWQRTPAEQQIPSTQHSKRSSSGSTTRRSNGSVPARATPAPLRPSKSGRAPLSKPNPTRNSSVGRAARRTTSDLFEALAASTEGGRTRQSDELSCIHSDMGTLGARSAVHTPDGRDEAELADFYETNDPVPLTAPHHDPHLPPSVASARGASEKVDTEHIELGEADIGHDGMKSTEEQPQASDENVMKPPDDAQAVHNPEQFMSQVEVCKPSESSAGEDPHVTVDEQANRELSDVGDYDEEPGSADRGEGNMGAIADQPAGGCDATEKPEVQMASDADEDDGYGSSDFESASPTRGPQSEKAENTVDSSPTAKVERVEEENAKIERGDEYGQSAKVERLEEEYEAEYENEFDAESPKSEDEARRVAQLRAELRVADEKADDDASNYSDEGFEETSPQQAGKSQDAAEGDAYASALSAALRKLKGAGPTVAAELGECQPEPSALEISKPPSPAAYGAPSAEARPDSQRRGGRTSRHGTGGGTKTAIQYTARDFFGDGSQQVETTSGTQELGTDFDQSLLRPTSRASVSTADHRTGPISPVSESVPDSSRGGRKDRVVSLEIGNFEEINIGVFPTKKTKKNRKSSTAESEGVGNRRGSRKHPTSQGLDL